jgi:hypothetical protein
MNAVAVAAEAVIGHNQPPPVRDILTEKYAGLLSEVERIAGLANDAPKKVDSDTALAQAGDLVKGARQLVKRLDAARTSEKEPHLTAGREIDAFFKVWTERLDRIAKIIEDRATEWQRAKAAEARRLADEEARRQAEEAARQREIARRAEEANRPATAAKHEDRAEAADDQAQRAQAIASSSAADLTRIRSSTGTVVSARQEWAFEITDYAAIPLDVLRPYLARADVEKAIRSHVRINKNTVPIPGVRIFEDVKANFR